MATRGHRDIFAEDMAWQEGESSGIRYARFLLEEGKGASPMVILSRFEPREVVGAHTHDTNYFEYVIEGEQNGFTSIPMGVYWAITTMTTVGFGDVTPQTDVGRFIASIMMLLGWGTLAVPTGIVSSEFTAARLATPAALTHCGECGHQEDDPTARFCRQCGAKRGGVQ